MVFNQASFQKPELQLLPLSHADSESHVAFGDAAFRVSGHVIK